MCRRRSTSSMKIGRPLLPRGDTWYTPFGSTMRGRRGMNATLRTRGSEATTIFNLVGESIQTCAVSDTVVARAVYDRAVIELGHATDRKPPFRYAAYTRVGFSDTDAQGVVYYGRYMPYFDLARTEYHRH